MKELEINVVAEVHATLNDDGSFEIKGANIAMEPPYPFADDYAAYDGEDWLSLGDVNALQGGFELLLRADGEIAQAIEALEGLREIAKPENVEAQLGALNNLLARLGLMD